MKEVYDSLRIDGSEVGNTYGKLTLIGPWFRRPGRKYVVAVCRCECGHVRLIQKHSIKSNKKPTKACNSCSQTKHGLSKTPEYTTWNLMNQRCRRSPSNKVASRYIDRGITVCERWVNSFEAFLEDMGPKPSPIHQIDRIDNNGNYEPGNCRWATPTVNANNRRNSIILNVGGLTMTVGDASRRFGIKPRTIRNRISLGWSHDDAVKTPADYGNKFKRR